MTALGRGVDALGIFLTGGAANRDPAASLGGAPSATRALGLGRGAQAAIPGLSLQHAFPANGEGAGTLAVGADAAVMWTPPGAAAGAAVAVAVGETRLVEGADPNRALRVAREAGLRWSGVATVNLVSSMNGALGQADLTSAQRAAGRTTYRAFALRAIGDARVAELRLWLPPVAGAQAAWSLAAERPVADAVQAIADEATAPAGLVFAAAPSQAQAIYIPFIDPGAWVGLWIRRAWPAAGTLAARELVDLTVAHMGAP